MPRKSDSADSIKLLPAADFFKVASKVFSTTKAESDRQMAAEKKHKRKRK